jgi:hypothetical protein
MLAARERAPTPYVSVVFTLDSHLSLSRSLGAHQGECLVVVWAIKHFRPYLYGTKFILYIDHQPIKWLMTNNKLTNKLVRWALIFQEYEFKVIHRPSITHQNTNTMSRRLLTTFNDFSEAKQDFNQIPTLHVSYAFSYLTLLQCNLVEHPIVDIWEDLDTPRFF